MARARKRARHYAPLIKDGVKSARAHAEWFPVCVSASKLPHPAIVDVSAWWLDAHHRKYVVPLDLW
jgi:hypothetical protein